jgi:hypothetical protein
MDKYLHETSKGLIKWGLLQPVSYVHMLLKHLQLLIQFSGPNFMYFGS